VSMDKNIPKQPKKRGRPLSSRKKKLVEESDEELQQSMKDTTFDDEQIAYTLVDEKLSHFSSLLRNILIVTVPRLHVWHAIWTLPRLLSTVG